jgi:GNAT superfamily N-acetyltransferase
MEDASLWQRMLANMAGLFPLLAEHCTDGRVVRLEGVNAAIVPSCPDRSIVNCVTYSDPAALDAALDELAAEYERAGVNAWTVWVPEHDTEAAQALERAGHTLDGQPAAMVRELDGIESPDSAPRLLQPEMAQVSRVNDAAYGLPGDFERAFNTLLPPEPAYIYLSAGEDGEPACTLVTYEEDGECGIYLVATVPEARGQGLARDLMLYALAQAQGRGCTTTSLQATALGRPVYERLGYRHIGAVQMWERRGD